MRSVELLLSSPARAKTKDPVGFPGFQISSDICSACCMMWIKSCWTRFICPTASTLSNSENSFDLSTELRLWFCEISRRAARLLSLNYLAGISIFGSITVTELYFWGNRPTNIIGKLSYLMRKYHMEYTYVKQATPTVKKITVPKRNPPSRFDVTFSQPDFVSSFLFLISTRLKARPILSRKADL